MTQPPSPAMEQLKLALDQLHQQPYPVGPLLHAARLLLRMQRREAALRLTRSYVSRFGVDPLAGDALLALAQDSPNHSYDDGQAIIREGDHSDSLFVITKGNVEVHRSGIGCLATLIEGQSFGEVALLAGIPRTASVFARGDVCVLLITQLHIIDTARRFPPLDRILRAIYRDRVLSQLIPEDSFLASLSIDQRHKIFSQFVPCTVPAGTAVLWEGREAAGFFIIVSGSVRIWRRDLGGKRENLATLGPGDFFGEISLLFEIPVTATVEAREQLSYFALSRRDFHRIMKSYPAQTERLLEIARARMGFEPSIPPLDVGLWNVGSSPDEAVKPEDSRGFIKLPGSVTCPRCGFDQAKSPVCVACCTQMTDEKEWTKPRLATDTVTIDMTPD